MRILLLAPLIAAIAAGAEAQVIGYGVGGPGGTAGFINGPSFSAAAGAELFAGDRASIGGEVGMFDHLWRTDRVGFRVELRDHIRPDDRGATHYWSARVGVSFR